jgi:hypothetical protein
MPSTQRANAAVVVSIVTPLHNKGSYVAATIRSVLNQTWADWELVVVENGSSDNGPEIVRQFSDSRIRLVVSPKCGPGAARNFGLGLTTGEWVLFLDADDLLEPDHLTSLLQVAAAYPKATLVAGGWKEFPDASPTELKSHRPATYGFRHDQLLASAVALAPWILHAAVVKQTVFSKCNRWPEHLDRYPDEDTAFWFGVLLDAEVAWSDTTGALYRRIATNSRSTSESRTTRVMGYSKIVEHNLAMARSRKITLPPQHHGYLTIMFEVSYRKAIAAGDQGAAALALNNATEWLGKCPNDSWHIRLRKWLGIAAFTRFRQLTRRSPL